VVSVPGWILFSDGADDFFSERLIIFDDAFFSQGSVKGCGFVIQSGRNAVAVSDGGKFKRRGF
jgi:hypothetical protein